ncbi:terpene synthase family protein [Streptomyces sp. NPDC002787]
MEPLRAALARWQDQLASIEELTPWALAHLDSLFRRVPADDATRAFELEVQSWALATGVYPPETAAELADGHLGMVTCYTTPDTGTAVRWPIAIYNTWITSWDDALVEKGVSVGQFAGLLDRLVRHGQRPDADTPTYRVLTELRERVIALGGRDLLDEFADQLALQFQAWDREKHWRTRQELPGLREYLPHHGCTMVQYSTMLLHRLRGDLLPPGIRFSSTLDHLAKSTCVVMGIENDLVGCRADLERGNAVNAVAIIAHAYDVDLATAFRCALITLATQWHAVGQLADSFCAAVGEGSPEARQARAITAFAHGFHTWHVTAPPRRPPPSGDPSLRGAEPSVILHASWPRWRGGRNHRTSADGHTEDHGQPNTGPADQGKTHCGQSRRPPAVFLHRKRRTCNWRKC